MKSLDLSNIVSAVRRLGAVRATFDHLQESVQETTDALARSLTSNNQTNLVLLYGCVNSGTGLNYIISAGAVYYQGEIYLVQAFTGTATGVQVPSLSIVTSWRAGDPVKYSDNNNFNTHKIRTMLWTIGASGAGLSDFSGLVTPVSISEATLNDSTIAFINTGITVGGGSGTVTSTVKFKKTGRSTIRLNGYIDFNCPYDDLVLTLPAGARPLATVFRFVAPIAGGGLNPYYVQIDPDGKIYMLRSAYVSGTLLGRVDMTTVEFDL